MAFGIKKIIGLRRKRGGGYAPIKKLKVANPTQSKFDKCVAAVTAKGGAYDPRGVCAKAGRKKYGKKKFQKMALAGKRRAAKRKNASERIANFKGSFTAKEARSFRTGATAYRVKRNKQYWVYPHSSSSGQYARSMSAAKKKGEKLARSRGDEKFHIQNQVTGTILTFKLK